MHAPPANRYAVAAASLIGSETRALRPSLEARSSLLERCEYLGVSASGVTAVLEGVIVWDVAADIANRRLPLRPTG